MIVLLNLSQTSLITNRDKWFGYSSETNFASLTGATTNLIQIQSFLCNGGYCNFSFLRTLQFLFCIYVSTYFGSYSLPLSVLSYSNLLQAATHDPAGLNSRFSIDHWLLEQTKLIGQSDPNPVLAADQLGTIQA